MEKGMEKEKQLEGSTELSNGSVTVKEPESPDGEDEPKRKYLEFVSLTDTQHAALVAEFGEEGTADRIQELNDGIGSKGYKYKSHYHTILSWDRKHKRESAVGSGKTRLFPIAGRTCSRDGCGMPAVYKDASGAYDHYYCSNHLPQKVKELYA